MKLFCLGLFLIGLSIGYTIVHIPLLGIASLIGLVIVMLISAIIVVEER